MPDEGNQQLDEELRRLKKRKGLSFKQILEAFGNKAKKSFPSQQPLYADPSSLSRIFNGGRIPTRSNLLYILAWGLAASHEEINKVLVIADYERLSRKEYLELDGALRQSSHGENKLNEGSPTDPFTPEASEVWAQVKAFQEQERPLAAEVLLSNALKTNPSLRSPEFDKRLESIRRRNTLEFFDPDNGLPTTLVYNASYPSPTRSTQISTTDEWLYGVRRTFDDMSLIYDTRGANLDERTITTALKESRNVISYASSKINPCTEAMLQELNQRLGLDLWFIYESEAERKPSRTVFTRARQHERAALMLGGKVLNYKETKSTGYDHGVLLRYRFPANDGRQWIIFAGCSRPASVAARKIVFDRAFGEPLWASSDLPEPLQSFACVFKTFFIPPKTDKPQKVEVFKLFRLS